MTRAARAAAAGSILVTLALGAPACAKAKASTASKGLPGSAVKPIDANLIPASVLGLDTAREDVSKALATGRRSYVETTSVYSFRKDKLLEATLQVSRFLSSAQYQSDAFRQRLVAGIGGVQATLVRVGSDDVYLTAANQQRIAVWFKGPYVFILSTREDYGQPRGLMRQLLGVTPS